MSCQLSVAHPCLSERSDDLHCKTVIQERSPFVALGMRVSAVRKLPLDCKSPVTIKRGQQLIRMNHIKCIPKIIAL